MTIARILLIVVVVAVFSASVWAVDYKADPGFVAQIGGDVVNEVLVLPDGKLLIAGEKDLPGSATAPFVVRLNTDGSIDSSFSVPALNGGLGQSGHVETLEILPNGQYLITGYLHVNSTLTNFARINPDGSIDGSLVPSSALWVEAAQPDGKLITCNDQYVFGGQTYHIAQRLNSNGTFDPSFRVTWADGGLCRQAKVLPDGKILLSGAFSLGGQALKGLQRVNPDGSLDTSFNPAITTTNSGGFAVLADGKILTAENQTVKRLLPDGSLDQLIPNCAGGFLGFENDNYVMSGCKKWASSPTYTISRVFPDGTVDPTLDFITNNPVKGIRPAGPNSHYLFGTFNRVLSVTSRHIVRLIPDTTPPKANFDFDGDGRSDISVFRPSNGFWYLNKSTEGLSYTQWGLSSDKVVAGDANRDGKTDIGIFRNGQWHAYTSGAGLHHYMCLGEAGDKPLVIHDRDEVSMGDRFTVRGLRLGSTLWFLAGTAYGNCWIFPTNGTVMLLGGEVTSDLAVGGDFNGDSRSEVGYFRDGYWYTGDAEMLTPPKSFQWGIAGDIPVPADYDGDRQTDYAIFRPSTGDWWINRTSAGIFVIRFGTNGDIPVPADYDGDGKVDVAIYRNGAWWQFLLGSGAVQVTNWGLAGDVPIPAQSQF